MLLWKRPQLSSPFARVCSDPRTIHSTVASDRGAGVFFGPDVTDRFCALNGISLVVRSHECVPEGACPIAVKRAIFTPLTC